LGKSIWVIRRTGLKPKHAGRTIVDAGHCGDTWTSGCEAHPKWGIYRSITDKPQIIETYLLLRNMRAYRSQ
jgi:hypothetical protein